MAAFMLNAASVTVNSVDLSSHVTSVTLSASADSLETTAMGDSSRTYIGGLKTGSLDVTFNQDYAASQVAATLDAIVGTVVSVVLKPVNASVSATNPSYTFSTLITEVPSISGDVGSVSSISCSWQVTGDITKATS
jgi:hypothetical protein